MAIFKTCEHCGFIFHGGDGFVRILGRTYCCEGCATADGNHPQDASNGWEELDDGNLQDHPLSHERLLDDMACFIDDLDTFFECLEDEEKLERGRELVKRFHLLYRV
jgi:hypothetical protein